MDHHPAQALTVTAIVALTVVNAAQLGLDPVTDGAEAGAIGEEGALIAADGSEDGAAAEEDAAASCGGQSFTAATKVLLADGQAVAMSGLHVGQKVKATDPKTGKTSVRMIDKVWVNHDTDLMDVTVHSKDGVSVVHTTQKHPFWDVSTRAWTRADHLRSGDELMSAAGVPVTVTRTKVLPGAADMWDLTVDGLHDFYILTTPAGTTTGSGVAGSADTILVHNCPTRFGNGGDRPPRAPSQRNTDAGAFKTRTRAWDAAQRDASNYRYARHRAECDAGCHVHLDIYNNKGELLETRHYSYQEW